MVSRSRVRPLGESAPAVPAPAPVAAQAPAPVAAPVPALPAVAPAPVQWTMLLGLPDDAPLDVASRIDMVERLAIVGQPWCVDVLKTAAREEPDPRVGEAIFAALRTL